MRSSDSEVAQKSIGLVGAPNSGKTTLYNWLTGSKFKTVNYPGATVEYSVGNLAAHLTRHLGSSSESPLRVMDTPGTYSLHPKSADEEVTLKALYENPKVGLISGVIVVLDGTQLARHLFLAQQVKEAGFPMVVVVTMADLLRRQGIELNMTYLEEVLGCPVLPFDGLLAGGLEQIVIEAQKLDAQETPSLPRFWDFTTREKMLLECEQIAQKALSHKTDSLQQRLEKITEATQKIDRVLLHPIGGLIFFVLIMGLLFSSIFWVAAPFMDMVDAGFSILNDFVVGLAPGSLVADFLGNGVIASFGAVMVFVPQIFILFLGIGLLEGSGYLARAATLIDKPFSAVGMSGRSFVPLLSGFACAVPAIIATRNISSTRDRWITNFIIPLMTCSARLPVYALLLAFLFHGEPAWKAGISLAALYIGSLVVGTFAAAVINKFLPKKDSSFFLMELPIYRRPKMRVLLKQALSRTMSYVKRAGPAIFLFAVIIWVGTNFPNYQIDNPQQKLEQSYAGQFGKFIEPVVAPMGVDWRVGVGLISAFAAREVFVSSLAVVFNITDVNEGSQQASLLSQMKTAVNAHGERIFTVSSVIGLLIFFMIALQCMSTVVVQIRESGSWKMAIGQLLAFNLVAYVLVVALVQGLRLLGVP